MSEVIIYGPPLSSYLRSVRMTAHEKGVGYQLKPVKMGSDEHRALHPFAKVPVLQHGDFRVYESVACMRYLDDAFDGPSLTPGSPRERAVMEQWISVVHCYLYEDLVRNYVLQYVFPKGADGKPDREVIDEALPRIERNFALLEEALTSTSYIAGKTLSLADLVLSPILFYVRQFPEGKALLERSPKLQRMTRAIEDRPSFAETMPSLPG